MRSECLFVRRDGAELRSRFRAALIWLFALLLIGACGGPSGGTSPLVPQPPHPQNLVATLEDEVSDVGDGRIDWATYWKLCWDDYPGAVGYQLQTMTSEGVSPRLKDQNTNCLRLEVAKNTNLRELGLHKREVMLALVSGQLSYRVRAVLADGSTSGWSPSAGVAAGSGLIASRTEAPDVAPNNMKPDPSLRAMPGNMVEADFTRGKTEGIEIQMIIDKAENWENGGRFFKSPAILAIPQSTNNLPRSVQIRARYLIGNSPVGQYSDIDSIATIP